MKKKIISTLIVLALLGIVDVLAIRFLIVTDDYPMDALTLAFIVMPFLLILNLIPALIAYLFKRKQVALALLLNAILSVVIFRLVAEGSYERFLKRKNTHHSMAVEWMNPESILQPQL